MTREQQIAQVITDLRDYVPSQMDDEMVDYAARQIVATLLPQVTTVAELEALPEGSLTVNDRGNVRRHDGIAFQSDHDWLAAHPLTVVWQPEVTA